MKDKLLAEILKLPIDERIQLVGDIWDSIAEDPESLDKFPPTDEQQKELDRRDREFDENPGVFYTWEEVKEIIRRSDEKS